MSWGNAWAFAGLLLLVLPVLIHLLARRTAKLQRFPTLRFLGTSRLLPRWNPRLTDPLLLALRILILSAAVVALAQPSFSPRAEAGSNQSLTRVVIVDTSASMQRVQARARQQAEQLRLDAPGSVLVQTDAPERMLAGASAWLSRKPTRRELVIVSDFQRSALDSAALSSVAGDIGVRLVRIDAQPVAPAAVIAHMSTGDVLARLTEAGVEWSVQPAQPRRDLLMLAGPGDEAVSAAANAALTLGAPASLDTTHTLAIVLPHFVNRTELMRAREPLAAPWMGNVLARLQTDSLLAEAAASAVVTAAPLYLDPAFTVVARNSASEATVLAAAHGERLLLFPLVDAGSVTSAALIASARRALSLTPPSAELDPVMRSSEQLKGWERAPGAPRILPDANNHSDGRWFWLLAGVLLIVETLMRRNAPQTTAGTQVREQGSERAA